MIYLVRIKHCFCWDSSKLPVDQQLIQPTQYLGAFESLSMAEAYKQKLDNREILPLRGTSPFIVFQRFDTGHFRTLSNRQDRLFKGDYKSLRAKLDAITSLSEEQFIQAISDLGITVPNSQPRNNNKTIQPLTNRKHKKRAKKSNNRKTQPLEIRKWYSWWLEIEPTITENQRQKIWSLLDRLDMFEVITVPLEEW